MAASEFLLYQCYRDLEGVRYSAAGYLSRAGCKLIVGVDFKRAKLNAELQLQPTCDDGCLCATPLDYFRVFFWPLPPKSSLSLTRLIPLCRLAYTPVVGSHIFYSSHTNPRMLTHIILPIE